MGLFGSKKVVKKDNVNNAAIITQGTKITGNLESNDTLHIDGEVDGNVIVNNIIIIGKNGVINGNVKAQKVICNGKIDGFVECESLEVLQNAEVSHKLISNIVIIDGKYQGEIVAKNVLVDTYGVVENKIQAKEIVIKGVFMGDLACEVLTTKPTGKIQGNMYVRNIRNEGGIVEGSIGQYKDIFTPDVKELEHKSDNIEDAEIEEK